MPYLGITDFIRLLTSSQAFHWADPDYESPIVRLPFLSIASRLPRFRSLTFFPSLSSLLLSQKTITKALTPDGSLVLIWNLEDETASPVIKSLRQAYQQHEAGSPQYRLRSSPLPL